MATQDHQSHPAFPSVVGTMHHRGMTLRDWFAGQVLAAIQPEYAPTPEGQAAAAKASYALADAMMAERDKR